VLAISTIAMPRIDAPATGLFRKEPELIIILAGSFA
jgi:hypothetical protein